jgi:fatty-acyl-CoA synthase
MAGESAATLNQFFFGGGTASGASILYEDRVISMKRLDEDSQRMAGALAGLGVKHGDRVAVWLPNTPAWLVCLFACARLGAIVVSINTRFRSAELEDIVGRSGAKLLLFWPGYRHLDFVDILEALSEQAVKGLEAIIEYDELEQSPRFGSIHGKPVLSWRDLLQSEALGRDEAHAEDGCIIFSTSGTTRAPKFVLHSQRAIGSHALDAGQAFGMHAPDVCSLLVPPMCGVFGLCMALSTLAAGRPLIMIPHFQAQQAADLLRSHAVTHMAVVGDVVAQLLATSSESRPFPALRTVIGVRAGQAAPAEARGLRLVGTYGSSELQAMLSRQDFDAPAAQRELGGGRLVADGGKVRARDEASGVLLPHGAQGELEFKLPSQMLGYYGNPEATSKAFTDDGFYRSGDLGYTVAEDAYVFLSRMGDALRLSGFLVNPGEIEAFMMDHPAIAAVQVVGLETAGQLVPVAFVKLRPGMAFEEAAILEYCARQMARYKVPRRVFALDEFPVTQGANGDKVQKTRLRDMARDLMA